MCKGPPPHGLGKDLIRKALGATGPYRKALGQQRFSGITTELCGSNNISRCMAHFHGRQEEMNGSGVPLFQCLSFGLVFSAKLFATETG
jgi:hypothetical protein